MVWLSYLQAFLIRAVNPVTCIEFIKGDDFIVAGTEIQDEYNQKQGCINIFNEKLESETSLLIGTLGMASI